MPKGPTHRKGRGPYATQACAICRAKKSKCDGVKPVCGTCAASGRDDECSWGRDTAPRKPRTEAHFEALRKRTDSLQAYVDRLEGILGKCVCQDVSSHLQYRPPQLGGSPSSKEGGDSDTDLLDSDEEISQELTLPTQRLKLDDCLGGLLLHGITAPHRFSNRPPNEVSRMPEVVEYPNATYVLQLDGVDISQSHPDLDWSRHLPREVALTRKQHDKILDLAFKFCTMFTCRVIPTMFLRDMYRALRVPRSEKPPRTPHYSGMLHNGLFSMACNFADDPHLRDPKTRRHFINAANACLEAECKKPDLSLVQALAFIGTFHADLGDRIQAELFFGMSSRIGMTLGLGVDPTAWVKAGLITNEEMIGRNRCYWTMFSLDVCWALYFGRDFVGPPVERRPPLPFVDVEADQIPWHYPPSKLAPQPNYLTLIFSECCALLLISRQIVDVVNGLVCSTNRLDAVQIDEQVTKIDLELNNWKSHLPPHLDITLANRAKSTPQRLMMHIVYWWCFITLHRPFFNRRSQPIQHSDREVDHVKLCTRAAENILELIETWSSLYTLRLGPVTLLQTIFSAGTVFLLRALQATASPRIAHSALRTALVQVEVCVGHLRSVGETWRAAARTADILQMVQVERLRPVIARRLAQRGEQLPPASSSSASPSSSSGADVASTSASTNAPQPHGMAPAPAASYAAPNWNAQLDPTWSQIPLDFFAPMEPIPGQQSSGPFPFPVENAQASTFTDLDIADLDMTAFLPNFDYLAATLY
ncbi:fungal-specific transcription factor domain-containing protein [Mycena polygramma]|nr:fungal-specific transcription factor domain-containing protein [Mycena polygramma]